MKMQPSQDELPERIRQQIAEHLAWCRQSGLPLYGLPETYRGLRMLGDAQRWQRTDPQGTVLQAGSRIELVHGDLSTSDPALQVSTATLPGPTAQELLDIEIYQRRRLATSTLRPLTTSFLIDGQAVLFQGVQLDDGWAVQTARDGFSLSVVGLRWPLEKLELISLQDIDPYLAGREQVIQRLRQQHRP